MGAIAYRSKPQGWIKWFLSSSMLLILFWLTACNPGEQPPAVGNPAPDFTAAATDGSTVSLSDFKNETPVLLFFHMAVG